VRTTPTAGSLEAQGVMGLGGLYPRTNGNLVRRGHRGRDAFPGGYRGTRRTSGVRARRL